MWSPSSAALLAIWLVVEFCFCFHRWLLLPLLLVLAALLLLLLLPSSLAPCERDAPDVASSVAPSSSSVLWCDIHQ